MKDEDNLFPTVRVESMRTVAPNGEIMLSPTVVIAQNDAETALQLSNNLHAHFAQVAVADTADDLCTFLQLHHPRIAVLDIELLSLDEIRKLARNFAELTIICTHRSPDEKMWMDSLKAGAVEFCHPQDLRSILRASRSSGHHHIAIAA